MCLFLAAGQALVLSRRGKRAVTRQKQGCQRWRRSAALSYHHMRRASPFCCTGDHMCSHQYRIPNKLVRSITYDAGLCKTDAGLCKTDACWRPPEGQALRVGQQHPAPPVCSSPGPRAESTFCQAEAQLHLNLASQRISRFRQSISECLGCPKEPPPAKNRLHNHVRCSLLPHWPGLEVTSLHAEHSWV